LYGFTSADYIPFRNASGGGRQLHFLDDKELDLDEISAKPLPKIPLKIPLQTSLKGLQYYITYNTYNYITLFTLTFTLHTFTLRTLTLYYIHWHCNI